jgi:hypothetical protein
MSDQDAGSAAAGPHDGRDRRLPPGFAALIIIAGSALGWAALLSLATAIWRQT